MFVYICCVYSYVCMYKYLIIILIHLQLHAMYIAMYMANCDIHTYRQLTQYCAHCKILLAYSSNKFLDLLV